MTTFMLTLHKISSDTNLHSLVWEKLYRSLKKRKPDSEPVSLKAIFDIAGMHTALQCAKAMPEHKRDFQFFAIWCARRVQHLTASAKIPLVLTSAEEYLQGAGNLGTIDMLSMSTWRNDSIEHQGEWTAIKSAASALESIAKVRITQHIIEAAKIGNSCSCLESFAN